MILQQIRLKGFLGHRGTPNANGGFDFVTVDWRSAPLWLVHGPNGAGKSSLFDAISFALWKRARGKGEGGTNFDRLVHHGVDRAEIELDIVIAGREYRVSRTIEMVGRTTKKPRVSGQVFRRDENGGWCIVPGFENKPEKWAEAALGMTWKTFSYAVLLRQGEADAFLKAEPRDRRETLWELLDMEHFQKLGKSAEDAARTGESDVRKLALRVEEAMAVGAEDIAAQSEKVAAAEHSVQSAQAKHKSGEHALRDAKNVAQWRRKIEVARLQQGEDVKLLERAEAIRADARREREIKDALPFWSAVWDARQNLQTETERWQEKSALAAQLQTATAQTQNALHAARDLYDTANEQWQEAQAAGEAARQDAERLAQELSTLATLEELEAKIEAAQTGIAPHREILQRKPEIERAATRWSELQPALPLLRALCEAQNEAAQARESVTAARRGAEKARADYEAAQSELGVLQAAAERAAQVLAEHEATLRAMQTELEVLKGRYKARKTTEGHDECPTCGSRLDSDEAHQRLHREMEAQLEEGKRRKREIARMETQREEYSRLHSGANQSLRAAQDKLQAALQAGAQKTSEEAAEEKHLRSRERAVEKAARECGAWAEYSQQLQTLEAEQRDLAGAAREKEALQRAEIAAGKTEAALKVYREQRQILPDWNHTQRAHLRQEAHNAGQRAATTQAAQEKCEQAVASAQSAAHDLEKQWRTRQSDYQTALAQRDDLAARRDDAAHRLDRALAALPAPWKTHPAREDEAELRALHDEHARLQSAPALAEQLDAAQMRSSQLVGEIKTWSEQIEAVPHEHRRAPDEVEAELRQASETLRLAQAEHSAAQETLRALQARQQEYSRLEGERDAATKEAHLAKKLAEALGKNGLQAEILSDAQRKLSHYANKTLDHLSNGRWQIALEPNEGANGLDILARDMDHPLHPVLAFEQTSSGEQFRIAVATAIAIGQAVSGRQAIGTLIVDEGFGRLDKGNRDLMVDELRRLSTEVLDGGRVIVVSHQEDVCEQFDHRLRIARDQAGVARVETVQAGA